MTLALHCGWHCSDDGTDPNTNFGRGVASFACPLAFLLPYVASAVVCLLRASRSTTMNPACTGGRARLSQLDCRREKHLMCQVTQQSSKLTYPASGLPASMRKPDALIIHVRQHQTSLDIFSSSWWACHQLSPGDWEC